MKKILSFFLIVIATNVWADQYIRLGGGGGTASGESIGDVIGGGTQGSVLFLGPLGTLAQDNSKFFWDDTNFRLGIGNATPGKPLDVTGVGRFSTGIITPLIFPNANSTTAIQIDKADGTTNIVNIDTTNGRVGIGTNAPAALFDVGGGTLSATSTRVGVGTSVPGAYLDVKGDPNVVNQIRIEDSTTIQTFDIYNYQDELSIQASPSLTILTADANGFWGMGIPPQNNERLSLLNNLTAATNYGLDSRTTGAGTTNIAGYFSSSGATNNYGLLVAAGTVGIGTTTPTQALEVNGGIRLNTSTSRPACAVGIRGNIWVTESGAGVTDNFAVCLKSAADTYSWVQIVTGG